VTEPVNEAGLIAAIRRRVIALHPHAYVIKQHGSIYTQVGVPDLLVCVDGLFVGMEAKFVRAGESRAHALGRVTPLQHEQIAKIRRAGGTAGVVTSVDEALALIDEAMSRN
jgi:hypothetical protein